MVLGTTAVVVGSLVVLLLLMGLSAFFSSSEIAMFSLEKHKLEKIKEDNPARGAVLNELRADPHRLLVTILVGNNVVNVAMSSIATILFALFLPDEYVVFATTVVVSFMVLVFGEIAPKSYAVENASSWSLRTARPLSAFQWASYPVVITFDYIARGINKITGGTANIETSYVTRDEIEGLVVTGEREGVIDEEEREMIQSVLRFSNTIAKEVMVPRLDMVTVNDEMTVEEILDVCIEEGVTRVPYYEDSLDHVEGVVNVREILRYGDEDVEIQELVTPALHVPETKEIDELLREMQENRINMAVVIDEFGTTEGLVTIEDIVEEIVGEIFEGEEEKPIERVDEDTLLVKGEVNIDEVNEALGIELPEEGEFETVAGFIYHQMGRLVEEGEIIEYEDTVFTVSKTENTRIIKVLIEAKRDE